MTDWGYRREMSPAARKVHRLRNLRIDEVSSVDRGAGVGVKVLLTKTHKEGSMSLQETIGKSFGLRASGQLSDFDLGVMHQKRAAELGKSLSEYYASGKGQRALSAAVKSAYYEGQV